MACAGRTRGPDLPKVRAAVQYNKDAKRPGNVMGRRAMGMGTLPFPKFLPELYLSTARIRCPARVWSVNEIRV